jgi:pimeloyl-ACP methyl ester carboxylesterase
LSFGTGLALELYRAHPDLVRSLILVSAYAGWAGSLPPEAAAQRKQRMERMIELPADAWAREWQWAYSGNARAISSTSGDGRGRARLMDEISSGADFYHLPGLNFHHRPADPLIEPQSRSQSTHTKLDLGWPVGDMVATRLDTGRLSTSRRETASSLAIAGIACDDMNWNDTAQHRKWWHAVGGQALAEITAPAL